MTQDQIIQHALQILAGRMRTTPTLSSPEAVRDYLRLSLHDRAHEVFACVFLDSQARELGTRALQERSHRRLRQRLRVGI